MLIQERFGAQSGLTDEQDVDNTWCNMSLTFAIQLSKKISQKWPSPYKWHRRLWTHHCLSGNFHLPSSPTPGGHPERIQNGYQFYDLPADQANELIGNPLRRRAGVCVLRAIWGQNMMLQQPTVLQKWGVSINGGSQNGWSMREHSIQMDELGVLISRKHQMAGDVLPCLDVLWVLGWYPIDRRWDKRWQAMAT